MRIIRSQWLWVVSILLVLGLAACGGGKSASSSTNSAPTGSTPLSIIMDAGPPSLVAQNQSAANMIFATITICTHGSTTACQTIDHIQVDTGSVGLRILSSALNGTAAPAAVLDSSSNPMAECLVFGDGHIWGSVALVDVNLGGSTLSNVPVHIIGSSTVGADPAACSTGNGPAEQTLAAFGANGILGIGNYIQDCGIYCAVTTSNGQYFSCQSGTNCVSSTAILTSQVINPASLVPVDNNGVTLSFPAVTAPGAASVTGTLYFGVNTETTAGAQNNNAIGAAKILQFAPATATNAGYLTATYNSSTYSQAFIDSGSNAYFLPDSSIPTCTDSTSFYCPTNSVTKSFSLAGYNGTVASGSLVIDNADTLFSSQVANSYLNVFPTLGGPSSSAANGSSNWFDLGVPFFLGRKVYIIFENATVGGVQGPAVAF
jgi:Protein of unknown function (DUF3443)